MCNFFPRVNRRHGTLFSVSFNVGIISEYSHIADYKRMSTIAQSCYFINFLLYLLTPFIFVFQSSCKGLLVKLNIVKVIKKLVVVSFFTPQKHSILTRVY